MNVYGQFMAQQLVDPLGLCTVKLVCANLFANQGHCGLEVYSGNSVKRWHVHSPGARIFSIDTCNVQPTEISIVIPIINATIDLHYQTMEIWHDPSGSLCHCIVRIARLIRSKMLTYELEPKNRISLNSDGQCIGSSTCNSNYSTHCMMKKCGIDWHAPSIVHDGVVAPGWHHRMRACEKPSLQEGWCYDSCICNQWKTIDDAWCADSPIFLPPRPSMTPQEFYDAWPHRVDELDVNGRNIHLPGLPGGW